MGNGQWTIIYRTARLNSTTSNLDTRERTRESGLCNSNTTTTAEDTRSRVFCSPAPPVFQQGSMRKGAPEPLSLQRVMLAFSPHSRQHPNCAQTPAVPSVTHPFLQLDAFQSDVLDPSTSFFQFLPLSFYRRYCLRQCPRIVHMHPHTRSTSWS